MKLDWGHLDTFYISGPMTGLPGYNYPQFHEVKQALLRLGVAERQVINPAENHDGRTDLQRHEYLATAVLQAANATIMVLLPGWEHSDGCRLEVQIGLNNEADFWLAERKPEVNASGWVFRPVDAEEIRRMLAVPRQADAVKQDDGTLTTFATGATRDTSKDKLNFEGFIAPDVLVRYAEYMHKHRIQSDGSYRDADNWQKGMPNQSYMESMFRHFMDVWLNYRGLKSREPDQLEALSALLFNVMGYMFNLLRGNV